MRTSDTVRMLGFLILPLVLCCCGVDLVSRRQVARAAPPPRVAHLWWAAAPLPCNQYCLRRGLKRSNMM